MIRVLIADDQDLVRLGLRTLVESEDDLALAGEAADGLRRGRSWPAGNGPTWC